MKSVFFAPAGINTGGLCCEERTFPAELSQLGSVLAFVSACAQQASPTAKELMQISLSVEEAFVNVANYAYPDRNGNVLIGVGATDGCITIRLADTGIPFDPLAAPEPDITCSAQSRKIGGLGIFMIKKQMDEISYKYENGKNVLVMKKKLGNK